MIFEGGRQVVLAEGASGPGSPEHVPLPPRQRWIDGVTALMFDGIRGD